MTVFYRESCGRTCYDSPRPIYNGKLYLELSERHTQEVKSRFDKSVFMWCSFLTLMSKLHQNKNLGFASQLPQENAWARIYPVEASRKTCQPSSKHQRLSHFKPLKRFQSSTTHFMSTFIPNISSNCSSLAIPGSRVIPQIALHRAFDLIQTKC